MMKYINDEVSWRTKVDRTAGIIGLPSSDLQGTYRNMCDTGTRTRYVRGVVRARPCNCVCVCVRARFVWRESAREASNHLARRSRTSLPPQRDTLGSGPCIMGAIRSRPCYCIDRTRAFLPRWRRVSARLGGFESMMTARGLGRFRIESQSCMIGSCPQHRGRPRDDRMSEWSQREGRETERRSDER